MLIVLKVVDMFLTRCPRCIQLLGVEPVVTRQASYVIANEIIRAAVVSERFSHRIGLDSSMGTEIMLE